MTMFVPRGRLGWVLAWGLVLCLQNGFAGEPPIDRKAWVTRHNVVLTSPQLNGPLSVGNGEFAFTADITGLQTFEWEYNQGIPLSTMSQWGFHAFPNPRGFTVEKYPRTMIETRGKPEPYLYYEEGKSPPAWRDAANHLYNNPTRMHLGHFALILRRKDGKPAALADLGGIRQELNLWTGRIDSRFEFDGQEVRVQTSCHPELNQIAVHVSSGLIACGQLAVELSFPYGSGSFAGNGADWGHPAAHHTQMAMEGRRADFTRTMDTAHYHAALVWAAGAKLRETSPHHFLLSGDPGTRSSGSAPELEFTAAFAATPLPATLPSATQTAAASDSMWNDFWSKGGVIDLSRSKDPRWRELERRIVLSRYLTRIQCAGSLPPQETGLTCNSWFGKFHLEMHWWHAAHFALWGDAPLLERSLPFYQRILPQAQAQAKSQGYEGARWPKCVGPAGEQGPTYLEPFLIWQQPHPIFYAELAYRAHPNRETLDRYRGLVFETARFMASFAVDRELGSHVLMGRVPHAQRRQYQIGPPFSDAAEVYWSDFRHQRNPTFEIAYWHWGLEAAQRWRERLGLPREAKWDDVLAHLPPLPTRDGLYVAAETATETFTRPGQNTSHPCMLAPLGILDGAMVDRATMKRTLHRVAQNWDWGNTWGWDYPMMAMTAARLGEGQTAIDLLLKDTAKNHYLVNGHNPQIDGTLPLYLPGNGGLLYATALMAAGWDGAPKRNAPGFPDDGNWTVRSEGLLPAP